MVALSVAAQAVARAVYDRCQPLYNVKQKLDSRRAKSPGELTPDVPLSALQCKLGDHRHLIHGLEKKLNVVAFQFVECIECFIECSLLGFKCVA